MISLPRMQMTSLGALLFPLVDKAELIYSVNQQTTAHSLGIWNTAHSIFERTSTSFELSNNSIQIFTFEKIKGLFSSSPELYNS